MTRPVEPGELVGAKYEILRRLGKGGMGVVFEVRHATIGRRLALKFLRADLAGDERRLTRFEREARHCGALHHENIAAVLDFATDDLGRPYLVMEFVDGRSLRELVEAEAPLRVARASDLIRQAARGLGAAHEAGILHRDLKPENLMLTRRADGSDWVKLLDFGVARLTEDIDATALTREGQTPGTPHYLAPEIARGDQPASVSSDIYSLGVVLFELLIGRRPHPNGSYHAVLRHVANGSAPSIAPLRADLPDRLARLVDRMLSQDPVERPQSAQALTTALQPFCADARSAEAPTVTTETPPVAAAAPPSLAHVQTVTSEDATAAPRRRWSLFALLLMAALGLAVAIARRSFAPESPIPAPTTAAQRTLAPLEPAPTQIASAPAPLRPPPPLVDAARPARSSSSPAVRELRDPEHSATESARISTTQRRHPSGPQRQAAPAADAALREQTPPGFDRRNPYRD